MSTFGLIWIIGSIIAIISVTILGFNKCKDSEEDITLEDIVEFIFIFIIVGLLSWMGCIAIIIATNSNRVIFKRTKK